MMRAGRITFLLLLAWWTWRFIAYPMREDVIGASVLHLPDLIFHEAGHVLFSPFGEFMTTLGGSLMQVLVPVICAIAFLTTNRDLFGVAVMGWWTGQNLLDVAIYINDARALRLTLVGGQTGAEVEGHDWERILTMTNALHLDHRIAAIAQTAGAVLMVASLVWAGVLVVRTAPATSAPRR
jgi:hypothetical protein